MVERHHLQGIAYHRFQPEVPELGRFAEVPLVQLHPQADFNVVSAVKRKFTAESPFHPAGGVVGGIASGLPAVAPRLHLKISGVAHRFRREREAIAGKREFLPADQRTVAAILRLHHLQPYAAGNHRCLNRPGRCNCPLGKLAGKIVPDRLSGRDGRSHYCRRHQQHPF